MLLQNGIIFITNIPLCVYIYTHTHIFFIQSSVDGHWGYFHVLAIVNITAVNIGVYVPIWIHFLQIYAQEWDCRIIWQLYF